MSVSAKNAARASELTLVFRRHKKKLAAVIRRMLRDVDESDDVLQDVFEEFIQSYDLALAVDNTGGWLMRVAQNKVIDRFRRQSVRNEYRFFAEPAAESAVATGNAWLQEHLRAEILSALAALPPEQRDVFVQHELEGKRFEEIAAATGVSVNTLLSRKRYAVMALQKHLKEIYDELE